MISQTVILLVCVGYSIQQGHPPGIPPNNQGQPGGGQVYEQDIRGHHGGFGANPHDAE